MKLLPLALLLGSCVGCLGGEWKPLLNGRDFEGWETYLSKPPAKLEVPGLERDAKGEYAQALGVNRDPFAAFSYVQMDGQPVLRITGEIPGGIATHASYSNFHLRLQVKWGVLRSGQKATQLRNSGLLYHAHGEHGAGNGRWLPSHQFQIQNGFYGDYIAMGDGTSLISAKRADDKRFVYDPSSPEITVSNLSPDPTRCGRIAVTEKPIEEWNSLELYCFNDEFVHVVNGEVVLRGKSRMRLADGSLAALKAGRIEFQAEGWEVFVRNLEIESIDHLPEQWAK